MDVAISKKYTILIKIYYKRLTVDFLPVKLYNEFILINTTLERVFYNI